MTERLRIPIDAPANAACAEADTVVTDAAAADTDLSRSLKASSRPERSEPPRASQRPERPQAAERQARMIVALVAAAGRMPLGFLRVAGAVLGVLVFAASPAYRRKVLDNLRRAGYPGPWWALRAAASAGQMLGELPWIWTRPGYELNARTQFVDPEVLVAAEVAGRGIVFLTPHLGGFEATARAYALRSPITVLFREPHKAALRPLLRQARTVPGLRAEPASLAGVRNLLRALRSRQAVGLLPDHAPGIGEGAWAPFFGDPAWTMSLPQKLVKATGAQAVFAVGERVRHGWRIHLWPMEGEPTPERMNARIEDLVRRWPEQYLWGYNRYKRPAGADG